MKKKKRKEKILNIVLAVFIVVASYTLVLNVTRLYNMYSKIIIEVKNYKELEEQLNILKGNVDKVNNLKEGYYNERELKTIKKYFGDIYNSYSNNILLKNKSGKYNYMEVLEILGLQNQINLYQVHVAERIIFKNNDKNTNYFLEKRLNRETLNFVIIDKLKLEISGSSFITRGNAITEIMYDFDGMILKELKNVNMLAEITLEKGVME